MNRARRSQWALPGPTPPIGTANKFHNKLNAETDVALARAAERIEASLNSALENYRRQLSQASENGLEEQRKAITLNISDIHGRLKRAGELLAGLDSEKLRARPC